MKTVILCGELGTRLSEEAQVKSKSMVEIGGRPILWHIMKIYERQGFDDFVPALGYKGEVVTEVSRLDDPAILYSWIASGATTS